MIEKILIFKYFDTWGFREVFVEIIENLQNCFLESGCLHVEK